MSFFSSKNHTKNYHAKHHHAKHHHRTEWDNSSDYQNYAAAVESMAIKPTNVPPYPADAPSNGYSERVFLYPRRVQEMEYERAPVRANSGVDEGCDVDAEAEDFIKFEHKKFAATKSMSAI